MSISVTVTTLSDTPNISHFIRAVYNKAIAPTYSDDGNTEFYKYITIESLKKRVDNDHWMLKADDGDTLVGIIEIRKNEHLSMLFVDTLHQKQGIGRQLLADAVERIKTLNPDQKTLTVHSTPNAVSAYQKLGFQAKSVEQNVNGIRFVTMEKILL